MIRIDTNVLVRFIIQDDLRQSKIVDTFLATLSDSNPGFISLVVLVEFCWVLNRTYKLSREEVIRALRTTIDGKFFMIELELLVREALLQFEQCDADFGNCLIAKCAHSAGCKSIVTLDRKAASSLGVQLLR